MNVQWGAQRSVREHSAFFVSAALWVSLMEIANHSPMLGPQLWLSKHPLLTLLAIGVFGVMCLIYLKLKRSHLELRLRLIEAVMDGFIVGVMTAVLLDEFAPRLNPMLL